MLWSVSQLLRCHNPLFSYIGTPWRALSFTHTNTEIRIMLFDTVINKKSTIIASLKTSHQYQSSARWWTPADVTCDKLSENTTFHTITPAVAVAMGTGDWDCMPLIVWVVHFAGAHEAESWFGGIHVCRYAAITAVRTGPRCCETSLWNLESLLPFITAAPRQYRLYSSSEARIVPLERVCAVTTAGLMSCFFFFFFFLKVETEEACTWCRSDHISEKCMDSAVMWSETDTRI